MKKLISCFFYLLIVFTMISCFNEQEDAVAKTEETNFFTNNGIEVKTECKNNSAWKPADKVEAKITAEENELRIKFDFSKLKNELLNGVVYKGDTLRSTIFNMQLMCNGKLMAPNLIKGKFTVCEDSSCAFYTSVVRLRSNMLDRVEIPFYALKDYPAGSKVQLQLRLWQDCFVGEEIWTKKKQGNYDMNYIYRDTLKKKLIDNVYSFNVTVPEIYKTQIVCDSIKLQNDTAWDPYGSDNTIWKSSLPDIYFCVSDEFWNEQSRSHTEKSSATFDVPDTLNYYHYDDDAIFRIEVLDHDNLSRDDVLGTWKGHLGALVNKNRYLLKFGHVDKFYLKKVEHGLQN